MSDIYLIISEDDFLLEEEKNKLIKEKQIDPFNITSYNFSDSNPLEILNEMTTISLLGDKRCVVITEPEFLKSTYKNKDVQESFKKYFNNPNEDTILIILANTDAMENEMRVILKDNAIIQTIDAISKDNLVEWIKNRLSNQGFKVTGIDISSKMIEEANKLI